MSTFHIRYYAVLREARGASTELVDSQARTADALFAELRDRHGFRLSPAHMKVAINDKITSWDSPLRDGDHVAFLPPFAGG